MGDVPSFFIHSRWYLETFQEPPLETFATKVSQLTSAGQNMERMRQEVPT